MTAIPETPHTPPLRIVTGHFSMRKDYFAYRSRGTPDWLVIYTVAGQGRFGYGKESEKGKEIVANPGDIMLLPPGTFHDYGTHSTAGRWQLLWAHFRPRPEWKPWLDWPRVANAQNMRHLRIDESQLRKRIHAALLEMHRRAISAGRLSASLAMNALEEAILWCETEVLAARTASEDPRITQAQEFLCQNLQSAVTLDDVCAEVGLSVSRFSHLFRKQTGMTPQRYYEHQRMERARQLLEVTAMAIQQIASEVGYSSPFYFTQRFKAHTGFSPRAYRVAQSETSK